MKLNFKLFFIFFYIFNIFTSSGQFKIPSGQSFFYLLKPNNNSKNTYDFIMHKTFLDQFKIPLGKGYFYLLKAIKNNGFLNSKIFKDKKKYNFDFRMDGIFKIFKDLNLKKD